MSLFPAYSATSSKEPLAASLSEIKVVENPTAEWLENNSYAVHKSVNCAEDPMDFSEGSSQDTIQEQEQEKEKKNKHKKKRKKEKRIKTIKLPAEPVIEFNGEEEYYVDKAPAPLYKNIRTLHKPACPRYHSHYQRYLGWQNFYHNNKNITAPKRYYRQDKRNKQIASEQENSVTAALNENDYSLQLGQLNRKTMESPGSDLKPWLQLISLQDRNPYRWSRLLLAEKKLDLVQRALVHHPRCEPLYRLYIEVISATYPSFEVSKMLDGLLTKDPHNYMLWTAQIMTTQGSMARCLVPDVLRIYERSMKRMHHSSFTTTASDDNSSDEVMLKLFNNCALFLRQAGLYEQFFALLKLALELNVSTEQFGDFAPEDCDQRTLIEYEELILQSGLPMNEIWLRIERLRQGYNFLPCLAQAKCSDPQRIVFSEDVCHYIYPLKARTNSFRLMLLIFRLLKLPFVVFDGLAGKFCARVQHIGDSDAIEDALAGFLRGSFALPASSSSVKFFASLYELSKEMVFSPTYLHNSIGHELYTRCLREMLLNCAAAHAGIDERKRIVFVLMWCRFERLLLQLHKCDRKSRSHVELDTAYVKAGRSRFKALLKQPLNRNVLNFYTEFAIYEFELLDAKDSLDAICNIFDNLISTNAADKSLSSDLAHTYVTYAEILVGRGEHELALQVIAAYALSIEIRNKATIGTAKKLVALQLLTEKLDSVMTIERNVTLMVLEQYLLPDYTVSLLKLRVLLQYLIGQKLEAIRYLDKLLNIFRHGGIDDVLSSSSDRYNFLRENIHELYVTLLQLPSAATCVVPNSLLATKIFGALEEFPRNIFLQQCCCMLTTSVPWYKIRTAILRTNPSVLSVVFLIAAARCRFLESTMTSAVGSDACAASDQKYAEMIVRNRILSIFKALTPEASTDEQQREQHRGQYNVIRRNALFWRLYLRCISDQGTAFETSKKCLLTALDECPWSKALYLDGATYVPQELTHLQDLIIEKQLRIYALPEELEILREQ